MASLLCGLHPYFTLSHQYLLFMASLLGLACGLALGSSCQLVSNFSEASQSALTTGTFSDALRHSLQRCYPTSRMQEHSHLHAYCSVYITY